VLAARGFLDDAHREDIARWVRAGKIVLVHPDVAADFNLPKREWRAGLTELPTEAGWIYVME
jgi:hypothetical protein